MDYPKCIGSNQKEESIRIQKVNFLSITACEAMENQLQHLGKRWATICHWTEQQWLLLQEVLLKWQAFAEDENKFSDWLTEKEAVLDKMKMSDLSDSVVAVEQVRELKVCCLLKNHLF